MEEAVSGLLYDAAQLNSLPSLFPATGLLWARIDREATGTTPVYSPIVGLYTCIAILNSTFLETYPIHVRHKQFFNARQKKGQSVLEFREELLSLIDEADGVNITVNDLV